MKRSACCKLFLTYGYKSTKLHRRAFARARPKSAEVADGAEEDAGRARRRAAYGGQQRRGCLKGGFGIVGIPLSPTLQKGGDGFQQGLHKIKPSNFHESQLDVPTFDVP